MLQLTVQMTDLWDEKANKFIIPKQKGPVTIQLEHSLISISKWESKWKKPFISPAPKSPEAMLDYIRCMTVTPNVDPNLYHCITQEQVDQVQRYIDDPMSATRFREDEKKKKGTSKIFTSEKIYARMALNGIPFECEKWHFNRLMALLRICGEEASGTKMSRKDSMNWFGRVNAARKAKHRSRG